VVHHHLAIVDGQLHHTTTILDDRARSFDDGESLRLRLDGDVGAASFGELAERHEVTRVLHRQHRGLRVLPVPWLFDVAASVILQQRVRFVDAVRSFTAIAKRFGPTTPLGRCFPHPRVIAAVAADELMPLGVDGQRARALKGVAVEALHSDLLHPLPADNVETARERRKARLARVPGVGPWTTAMIMGFGFGDSDAVVTGDLHLPHLVTRVLGGDDDGTDARMVALLAPFVGHRFRVTRLLWAARLGKRPTIHRRSR
jgi:3-methyladenine DNA glycosylase/8-oxoguanine DNA glycosylase